MRILIAEDDKKILTETRQLLLANGWESVNGADDNGFLKRCFCNGAEFTFGINHRAVMAARLGSIRELTTINTFDGCFFDQLIEGGNTASVAADFLRHQKGWAKFTSARFDNQVKTINTALKGDTTFVDYAGARATHLEKRPELIVQCTMQALEGITP